MDSDVSSYFAVLRQIRSIRRSVTKPVRLSLVASLVLTRLDYGKAMLSFTRKFDHVTPILQDLHWLHAPQRVEYKLAVLVYRCLHDMAPPYLAGALQRVSDVESRQRLRSASMAHSVDTAFNAGRPRIAGCWCACREQFAAACDCSRIATNIQTAAENCTFYEELPSRLPAQAAR
jgi:hypothetical protein